jgi:hypothetical protein
MICALANHIIMLCGVGSLARRRIEQHAYIPYTHGSRHVCDRLLTKRRLARRLALGISSATALMRCIFAQAVPPLFTQNVNHDAQRERQSDG